MVLSFGVIGTSWITSSWIECAQATGKWKLAAVYSRSSETALSFAAKHKCSRTYTDLDALYADPDLDAIYIASVNSLHYTQAKAALSAGKHVILEKPSCSTLAEFDDLFHFAKKAPNGARLIEAYRHIQEMNFKIIQEALPLIGTIYGANLVFAQYSSRYDLVLKGETPNVFSPEFSSSCITDMGVYPIAAAIALFGRPKSQTYHPIIAHTGTDVGGPISLIYDTFTVSVTNSKCYTSSAPTEIYGERGTITLNSVTDIDSVVLRLKADKSTKQLAESKAPLNLMEEAEEHYRLIEEMDSQGIARLADLSRAVLEVTTTLRRQCDIRYAADT